MSSGSPLADGTSFGPYRIGRLLGAGGMGAVYQATQLENGREVALKVLAHDVDGAAFQERFAREGRLAASLSHPNVVYVFRAETIEGHPAIAMELVPGGTLEERVEREGALPVPDALRCIQQVIDGLEAAHAVGILHRDVKPANCYVGADGTVKIGDFGLARPEASDNLQLTQRGMFLGTPAFASPEQLVGDPVDVRSDLYAVGATLHYLLSGKPRYRVDSAARLIALVMRGVADDLEPLPSTVPIALQAVVQRCLARDPAARFHSYEALREALRAFQPKPEAHAPLRRRVSAAVLDVALVMCLDLPVGMLVNMAMGYRATTEVTDPLATFVQLLAFVLLVTVYYGLSEGRWGASIGKWLLRVRVEGEVSGQPPGVPAAMARAALMMAPVVAADGIGRAWGADPNGFLMFFAALMAKVGALFLPRARRVNGWWGEHERLSHTRVVRVTATPRREPLRSGPSDSRMVPFDGPGRVGPFDVRGRLPSPAPTPVLLGHDPALDREVWIVTHEPGVPAVRAAVRASMRAGTPRWIAGQRQDRGGWDAYAAIRGCSLTERLRHHAPWEAVRGWLADLARELLSREHAGIGSERLTPAHVWIGEDGQGVVLPFALGAARPVSEEREGLLAATVDTILATELPRGGALRWPARAHRMLEAVRTMSPAAAAEVLTEDSGEPAVLTTQRRLVAWGIPVGLALVPALVFNVAAWSEVTTADAETRALLPVLHQVMLKRHDAVPDSRTDSLMATYAGLQLPAVRARVPRGSAGFVSETSVWDPLADSLITEAAQAAPAMRAAAMTAMDRPQQERLSTVGLRTFGVRFAFGLLLIGAYLSLAFAVLTARVPLLALLGLAVVDHDGRRVGRLRLLARQAVTWGPSIVAAWLLKFTANGGTVSQSVTAGLVIVAAATSAATLWVLQRTPHRGIADRLAGTVVVPD